MNATPRATSCIEYALMALAVFAPLAFGSVHTWAYSVLELGIFSALLLWLAPALLGRRSRHSLAPVTTPLLIPFALFLCLALFQLAPLPPEVLKTVSPATYALYAETVPDSAPAFSSPQAPPAAAQAAAGDAADDPSLPAFAQARAVSVYSRATREEFLKFLAYGSAFFLLLTILRTRAQVKRMAFTLVLSGALCALLAIAQQATRTDKIFWFWQSPLKTGDYFGPYVNANHFAGCLELTIPLAIGLLVSRTGPFHDAEGAGWKRRVSAFEHWLTRNIVLLAALIIMIAALFFSLSRGGILAFLGSMAFMGLLLSTSRSPMRQRTRLLSATLGLTALFLLWVGLGPILKELSTLLALDRASPGRPIVWQDTLAMARDFPVFGIGLGCFRFLYPAYRSLPGDAQLIHAENDWVELLAETGAAGFLCFFGGLVYLLSVLVLRWYDRQDPLAVGIGLGGMTSLTALLLHSLVDFNLRIPANAFLLFMVLGLTVAALYLSRRFGQEVSLLPRKRFSLETPSRRTAVLLPAGLVAFCALLTAESALADIRFQAFMRSSGEKREVRSEPRSPDASPFPPSILSLDPSNARYHHEAAWAYARLLQKNWERGAWNLVQGQWRFAHDPAVVAYGSRARAAFARAVDLQPTNAWYHLDLGWMSAVLEVLDSGDTSFCPEAGKPEGWEVRRLEAKEAGPRSPNLVTSCSSPRDHFRVALRLDRTSKTIRTYLAAHGMQSTKHATGASLRSAPDSSPPSPEGARP